MSIPNPLAPQGSLLEQQAKGRSTFHVISFIGAVHVMLLCGILWTACGKDDKTKEPPNTLGVSDLYTTPADPGAGATVIGNTASNIASTLPGTPGTTTYGGGATAPGATVPGTTPSVATPALPPSASPTTPGTTLIENTAAGSDVTTDYKVAKGDIGTSIAKKHGVTMKALASANPDVNWNRLKINQLIKVPAAIPTTPAPGSLANDPGGTGAALVYAVKAGDTGIKIATKHGVKWADIRRANNLRSDTLRPGQKLVIPGRTVGAGTEGAAGTGPATDALQPTAIPVRTPGQ